MMPPDSAPPRSTLLVALAGVIGLMLLLLTALDPPGTSPRRLPEAGRPPMGALLEHTPGGPPASRVEGAAARIDQRLLAGCLLTFTDARGERLAGVEVGYFGAKGRAVPASAVHRLGVSDAEGRFLLGPSQIQSVGGRRLLARKQGFALHYFGLPRGEKRPASGEAEAARKTVRLSRGVQQEVRFETDLGRAIAGELWLSKAPIPHMPLPASAHHACLPGPRPDRVWHLRSDAHGIASARDLPPGWYWVKATSARPYVVAAIDHDGPIAPAPLPRDPSDRYGRVWIPSRVVRVRARMLFTGGIKIRGSPALGCRCSYVRGQTRGISLDIRARSLEGMIKRELGSRYVAWCFKRARDVTPPLVEWRILTLPGRLLTERTPLAPWGQAKAREVVVRRATTPTGFLTVVTSFERQVPEHLRARLPRLLPPPLIDKVLTAESGGKDKRHASAGIRTPLGQKVTVPTGHYRVAGLVFAAPRAWRTALEIVPPELTVEAQEMSTFVIRPRGDRYLVLFEVRDATGDKIEPGCGVRFEVRDAATGRSAWFADVRREYGWSAFLQPGHYRITLESKVHRPCRARLRVEPRHGQIFRFVLRGRDS